ncbi:hypothetical protein CHS0354_023605, partial [Potamilus streckersoni]
NNLLHGCSHSINRIRAKFYNMDTETLGSIHSLFVSNKTSATKVTSKDTNPICLDGKGNTINPT